MENHKELVHPFNDEHRLIRQKYPKYVDYRKKFEEYIKKNYHNVDVFSNGNCFFSAMALIVYGCLTKTYKVRIDIYNWLVGN